MHSLFLVAVLAAASLASDICWKDAYSPGWSIFKGRGIHTCPSGYEKSGLLCYKRCRDGYYGKGPVCWSKCPSGWRDDGALCNNRGGWTKRSKRSGCPWYNICGIRHSCSKCPSGTRNDGCFCHMPMVVRAKKSYGRGVGKPLQCSSNEVQQGLLCYPKCRDRDGKQFQLVAGLCWERCSGNTPHSLGMACCKDRTTCDRWAHQVHGSGVKMVGGVKMAVAGASTGVGLVAGIVSGVVHGAVMVKDLMKPICDSDSKKNDAMHLLGFGKCKGTPFKSVRDKLSSECVSICEKEGRCTYVSHASNNSECRLYNVCTLDTDKGFETFADAEISSEDVEVEEDPVEDDPCHRSSSVPGRRRTALCGGRPTLMRENKNCWRGCHRKGGKCNWCGSEGLCCRKGWTADPAECQAITNWSGKHTDRHVCIAPAPAPQGGKSKCFNENALAACKASGENSTKAYGCQAYAKGWAKKNHNDCPSCYGTKRAYSPCSLAECNALCGNLYGGVPSTTLPCKQGCAEYRDLIAAQQPPTPDSRSTSHCLYEDLLKKCNVWGPFSKQDNGCQAFALGWGWKKNDCHSCSATERAYSPCKVGECRALCDDLYSDSWGQSRLCKDGCDKYLALLAARKLEEKQEATASDFRAWSTRVGNDKCLNENALAACKASGENSTKVNGCQAYAKGWAKKNHNDCPSCYGTKRAYSPCSLAECNALCGNLYGGVPSTTLPCKQGCAEYRDLIADLQPTSDPHSVSKCYNEGVLESCNVWGPLSKQQKGCEAFAQGWGRKKNDCDLCSATERAHSPCSLNECRALCDDLYSESGNSDRSIKDACKQGCDKYKQKYLELLTRQLSE